MDALWHETLGANDCFTCYPIAEHDFGLKDIEAVKHLSKQPHLLWAKRFVGCAPKLQCCRTCGQARLRNTGRET